MKSDAYLGTKLASGTISFPCPVTITQSHLWKAVQHRVELSNLHTPIPSVMTGCHSHTNLHQSQQDRYLPKRTSTNPTYTMSTEYSVCRPLFWCRLCQLAFHNMRSKYAHLRFTTLRSETKHCPHQPRKASKEGWPEG